MSIFNLFNRNKGAAKLTEAPPSPRDLPMGGRSSQEPYVSALDMLLANMGEIDPMVPWEFLDILEVLSITNPDLSQAVGNIILLGNSGHEVELEAPEAAQRRFLDSLEEWGLDAYPFGGGVEGLVTDLFGQLARYGALSMEWVVNDSMDDLDRAVLVPVKSIRFKLQEGKLAAFQKVTNLQQDLVPLNPWTYLYLAPERLDRSPYGIPTMLAALRHVAIQEDIAKQLGTIAKKVGLFGFVQILLSAPIQREKESDDAYRTRCMGYLEESYRRTTQNGSFQDGIAMGFKDVQEFTVTPSTANPAGVKDMIEVNETLLASGLRQDPAMMGRTYSTTETYANVVLEKTIAQLGAYQRLVGLTLERGYKLKAWLLGVPFDRLKVTWKPSALIDQKVRQEVYKLEIENAAALYQAGVIDQAERANLLGYAEAAQEEPRQAPTPQGLPMGLKAVQDAANLAKRDPGFHQVLEKVLAAYAKDPEGAAKIVAEARLVSIRRNGATRA